MKKTPLIHCSIVSMWNSSIASSHISLILSSNKVTVMTCQNNILWCLFLKKKSTFILLHFKEFWFQDLWKYQNRYLRYEIQAKCTASGADFYFCCVEDTMMAFSFSALVLACCSLDTSLNFTLLTVYHEIIIFSVVFFFSI